MRKFLICAIPIITIVLFIFIMQSGSIVKKTLKDNEDISKQIDNIIQKVNDEDWDDVSNKIDQLDKTWKKVLFKIQFSSERDEINDINSSFARLRGAVTAKDTANALIELNEANSHWERIGE